MRGGPILQQWPVRCPGFTVESKRAEAKKWEGQSSIGHANARATTEGKSENCCGETRNGVSCCNFGRGKEKLFQPLKRGGDRVQSDSDTDIVGM